MRTTGVAFALLAPLSAAAQQPAAADASPFRFEHVDALPWRSIGPANMGGRIVDIDVPRGQPAVWYVATASGGLWKTQNAGTTWEALFQHEPTVSLGDVAVAPSNPDVVWVGTGEENARNSVSWGDGVYKSVDGGKTWRHMGLDGAFQIGHIAIHPERADTVFVGALGRLWSHGGERGVYRSLDGGETWDNVLWVDEKTGCIDVRIDPQKPTVVYAAMYERLRDGFDGNDPAVRFGAGAGLWRSDDGGSTWKRLSRGLPTCAWGRSGLAIWEKSPATVFAIVETERSGWATGTEPTAPAPEERVSTRALGLDGEDGDGGARLASVRDGSPASAAGLAAGDVVVQWGEAKVESLDALDAVLREARPGQTAAVTVERDGEQLQLEVALVAEPPRRGRGRGNRPPHAGRLGGQAANVHAEQGDRGYETGGIFRSDDRGDTWRRINSLTDRPFYYSVIAVDPQDDRSLYHCGLQFWASHDGGETFRPATRGVHGDFHAVWVDPQNSDHLILGCDGGFNVTWDRCRSWEVVNNIAIGQFYHVDVDGSVPYRVYGGLQDNGTWGGPSQTRYREGITKADWVQIYGGDGFTARVDRSDPATVYATSQGGNLGRVDMRTGETTRVHRPRGRFSFNWDTPFLLSPHNPRILYFAGNHAFRSLDRGGRSVQLTTAPLGLTPRGTATAIAESPVQPGLLWIGTDDGALWRSNDNGGSWVDLHAHVAGLPAPRYVSSLHASRFSAERIYATFDGHRSDDFGTHVYVSDDLGETWTSLLANLPDEPAHVCREDPVNEDLLYLGTEYGCWVSLDRGERWLRLGTGMPTVAVRDFVVHERDADLVAATHGRGIWILDVAPLQQLTAEVAASAAHLFAPEPAYLWQMRSRSLMGDKDWRADNPPYGAVVHALFANAPAEPPELTVHDVTGAEVARLRGEARAGVQRFVWDARIRATGDEDGEPERRGRRGRGRRQLAAPGAYAVRLQHGGKMLVQPLTLLPDPLAPPRTTPTAPAAGEEIR